MFIRFHSITVKNFMSYGNVDTSIELDQHHNTLVTGTNGSGKSSIVLDGISYALFNKPYRKITLGLLVNSINKKQMLTKIDFSIGTDKFLVVRGQKPNVFEIFKNGELIKEDSSGRGYQAMLESDILKMNYKTFKQIIVIGSATYVPFMSLDAADRRKITEDVLDIAVFSSMLEIANKKVKEHKSVIDSLTYEIGLLKTQITSQKELLTSLEQETTDKKQEQERIKQESLVRIQELEAKKESIEQKSILLEEETSKLDNLVSTKEKLEKQIFKLQNKKDDSTNRLSFYEKDSCPTCFQQIPDDFRKEKQSELNLISEDVSKQILAGNTLLEQFKEKVQVLSSKMQEYSKLNQERRDIEQEIRSEQRTLSSQSVSVKTDSLDLCKQKLKDLILSYTTKVDSKNQYSKDIDYYKVSVDILKDSGIKSKIISTFIPLMNQMINEYLEKLDLFISFELDEMFNETIKSRHRDAFTYNSFSEGEKKKIDLAILFSWRKIAMSRNSVSTNLLIFDETLDSSIDENSVDTVTEILSSIESTTNTIVISHRNVGIEMFDRHIKTKMHQNFSILEIE